MPETGNLPEIRVEQEPGTEKVQSKWHSIWNWNPSKSCYFHTLEFPNRILTR